MSTKDIYGESYKPISEEQVQSTALPRQQLKEESVKNQRVQKLGHLLREARTENATLKRRLREAEAKVAKHQETEAELAWLRRTLSRR